MCIAERSVYVFFISYTATTGTDTLSLHDARPIYNDTGNVLVDKHPRELPEALGPIIHLQEKLFVPVKEYPDVSHAATHTRTHTHTHTPAAACPDMSRTVGFVVGVLCVLLTLPVAIISNMTGLMPQHITPQSLPE